MKKKLLVVSVLMLLCIGALASCSLVEHIHSYDEWFTAKNATCTVDGTQERTCTCGEKESRSIPALGHIEVIDSAVAPTCTETGLTEGKHCSRCSTVLIPQEILPASHKWWATYQYNEDEHWMSCTVCEATGTKTAHDVGRDGYCKICDKPITGSEGVWYFLSSYGTYAEVADYTGDSTRVIISSEYMGVPVTHISDDAFKEKAITSIILSSNTTSIGNSAFSGCSGLTSITIPDSVTSIGDGAFYGCSGLTSITIPDSVTSIGDSAFSKCSGLTSITIPNSVTSIGDSTFSNCSGLKSVAIGNGVERIGDHAFSACKGLTSITIPDSVTSIGDSAFFNCFKLTNISIPDSITNLEKSAFNSCTGLIENINGATYVGNVLLDYDGSAVSLEIREGTVIIANYALSSCSKLRIVVIPDSVKSIGEYAFEVCSELTSIIIPDHVKSIGDYAFLRCSGLTSVTIGSGVKSIGYAAFKGCSGLTSITLPDSVTSIRSATFYDCSGLTSITIPDSIKSIGEYAFRECSRLTSILYRGSESQWNAISKDSNWMFGAGWFTITYNYTEES